MAGAAAVSGYAGGAADSYKVTREAFVAHLDALQQSGSVVGLPIGSVVPLKGSVGRNVVLTFDDGGTSAIETIAPLLEQRWWRGHFFIASDQVGAPGFCGASDLRTLAARGHVVGSHSRTHPLRMASLSADRLRDEWGTSVARLADVLGALPTVASVPGGALSRRVIETAAEAGVRVLFTSEPTTHVDEHGACATIGRFTLRRHHDAGYVRALVQPFPAARLGQWASWNARKVAKAVAGPLYLRLRSRLLDEP